MMIGHEEDAIFELSLDDGRKVIAGSRRTKSGTPSRHPVENHKSGRDGEVESNQERH